MADLDYWIARLYLGSVLQLAYFDLTIEVDFIRIPNNSLW